jgi:protein-S-isoprenylcysteine O-methyltransferase Ste14
VPSSIERSTYVLLSSLVLILLYWQWQPLTQQVWSVSNPVGAGLLSVLFWVGWVIVLVRTFLINPLWIAAGLCALAGQKSRATGLSRPFILPVCATSGLF